MREMREVIVIKVIQNVPVHLMPEPTNPKESVAISFACLIEGNWERIGYVV